MDSNENSTLRGNAFNGNTSKLFDKNLKDENKVKEGVVIAVLKTLDKHAKGVNTWEIGLTVLVHITSYESKTAGYQISHM